jgi:hypothetical protein
MRRPLFHLVDQIVRIEKYFDVSRLTIEHILSTAGKYEITTDCELTDEDGTITAAELRLNIAAARPDIPSCWQMALKLHRTRIDGIDYEAKYTTIDGTIAHGWHRHRWIASEDSAERGKVPAAELDGVETREQFLIRGLSLLRIRLNKADHGIDFLPFDP